MNDSETTAAEMLKNLDARARERNERVFGLAVAGRMEWHRRSRASARSPMTRIDRNEILATLEASDEGLNGGEVEDRIAAHAAAEGIAWDSPWLTVFETTRERAREITEIHNRRRWEPDVFTIDDLWDSERMVKTAKRTEYRLAAEAKARLLEHAQQAWCPVGLRRGPSIERSEPHGCGVLATDGTKWAVITAAHVLGTPATPDADLADEPIWASVTDSPRPSGATNRSEENKTGEATLIRTLEHTFLDPRTMRGRLDVGIARVDADRAGEACKRHAREPLDLRRSEEWTIDDPIVGVKYVVGMPMDRQNEGRGAGLMEAAGPREGTKVYRPGGQFHYISLGANGPNEGNDREGKRRSWQGYSGGPIWAYELRGEERRIAGSGTEARSKTDWKAPKLAGIMFFQAGDAYKTNGQKPRGWRDEIYALHVNGAALELIRTMFDHEADDGNALQPIGCKLTTADLATANERWREALRLRS